MVASLGAMTNEGSALSNWKARQLQRDQIKYAAWDAQVSLDLILAAVLQNIKIIDYWWLTRKLIGKVKVEVKTN